MVCAPAGVMGSFVARYYFHLRDGEDHLIDAEGIELFADAVSGVALVQARDCMAGDIKTGLLKLDTFIDVYDRDGALVHSLSFGDAVEIIPRSTP